jgi:hypothetical protein
MSRRFLIPFLVVTLLVAAGAALAGEDSLILSNSRTDGRGIRWLRVVRPRDELARAFGIVSRGVSTRTGDC